MIIKRGCAAICGIPNSRGLFLEPAALLHLLLSLIVFQMLEILTDDDGNEGVGEPRGCIDYALRSVGIYNHRT